MPEIFAPRDIRATSSSGATCTIKRGEKKTIGRELSLDAMRQGGIDTALLAELPKLKDPADVKPAPPPRAAKPQHDIEDMPNAAAEDIVGDDPSGPEDDESGDDEGDAEAANDVVEGHPGDSDIVSAIVRVLNNADPDDLKSDGMPKSFAITREVGYQIDKEERDAALEIVAKRLDR